LITLSISISAQIELGFIRDGNASYKEKSYTDSEENYRRALEVEATSYSGTFNLGNSIYQQGRYQEAVKHFETATAYAPDEKSRAQALHNLGNSHLKLQDYENSAKAYIEALKINPGDMDTKYNLAYAMQKLKEQQQQQQEQQQDQENQDENSEDQENKDQEQKDQEQKDQEQQEQDQQDQENKGENQQNKDQDQKDEQEQKAQDKEIDNPEEGAQDSTLMMKKEMSMEEVLKILEIMDNEEQKVQQKLRAPKGDRKKTDKDKAMIEDDLVGGPDTEGDRFRG